MPQLRAVMQKIVQFPGHPHGLRSFSMVIRPSALPSGAGLAIIAHANASPYSVGAGPLVKATPQCTG